MNTQTYQHWWTHKHTSTNEHTNIRALMSTQRHQHWWTHKHTTHTPNTQSLSHTHQTHHKQTDTLTGRGGHSSNNNGGDGKQNSPKGPHHGQHHRLGGAVHRQHTLEVGLPWNTAQRLQQHDTTTDSYRTCHDYSCMTLSLTSTAIATAIWH